MQEIANRAFGNAGQAAMVLAPAREEVLWRVCARARVCVCVCVGVWVCGCVGV